MLARAILLCLTLACYASLLMAQPQKAVFIGTEEGLSQGMIYCLLQSRDGFIWIATKDGLNRYDGYRFEIFTPDAFDPFSIANGEIQTIFEDSRGWLWVCYIGGIDIFDPSSKRFFHLPVKDIEDFRGYRISFWEDGDGTMWVAGRRGILKIYSPEHTIRQAMKEGHPTPSFKCSVIQMPAMSSEEPFEANSIFRTKAGNLLVATTRGLYALDASKEKLSAQPVALPGFNITFFGEDNDRRLWFKSQYIVCCIHQMQERPDFMRKTAYDNDWILDSADNIWGREGMNLLKWRASDLASGKPPQWERRIIENESYSDLKALSSVLIDLSGNAWVGTTGYGVVKYPLGESNFRHYRPKVSHRNIYEDPSGRFFTLKDLRVIYADSYFNNKAPNPWFSKVPASTIVKHLVFDQEGNCWINTDKGELCRIDAHTKNLQCHDVKAYGVWCNRKGEIIALYDEGILTFNPHKQEFLQYPFTQTLSFNYSIYERYNLFYEGRDGSLWIIAYEGLLRAIPHEDGYRYEHYRTNSSDRASLSNNVVFSVMEDPLAPQQYLWVGTKGGGLNRLDLRTGKFQHFTVAQGLPDNVIYGILPDNKGHLWLSTNKGLCRFNCRDFSIKIFTVADGLQGNEFNQGSFLKTRDGTMIFGGVNGLTVFHPDSLRFNQYAPPTRIVEIMVNNHPVNNAQWIEAKGGKELVLSHEQNLVTIGFVALDYANPAKNQYRYQLFRDGVRISSRTEEWIEIGAKNSLQFNALQPGRYVFRVLGSNNDGVWSTEAAELRFRIDPPWWASWWAWCLYVFIVLVIASALYQYQLRQRLARQETMRLRELDAFKSRFFTNVTHEFRTPLTVILGIADQIEKTESKQVPSEGASLKGRTPAALIKRSGENLLRLVNQILDLAKLESGTLQLHYVQGNVIAYLRYIAESLHSAAQIHGVQLRLEGSEQPIVMDYDPERLQQVVYNLLSNAIKFTPAGGVVALRMACEEGSPQVFVIQVADTGVGIPPEDLPHIFDRFYQAKNLEKARTGGTGIGLALTRELVQAMGGAISVHSEVGKGTAFTVRLPISHKAALEDAPGVAEQSNDHHWAAPTSPSAAPAAEVRPALLLVEDNPDVLEYLAACLAPYYALDFEYNGRIGIEKAIETVPDLIISDVMMPEKDGFELCHTLKNDERTSHIPIVLLTARADMQNRIAGLQRGADAYLGKPFHQEELLVTLANLLEVRKKLQVKYAAHPLSQQPAIPHVPDPEDVFLQKVRLVVEQHLSEPELDMSRLERMLSMSRSQLFRKIKALTGRSPSQFVRSVRLHHGKHLLQTTNLTVSEIAYEVGFSSVKYFSDAFLEEFGERPTKVREGL